VKYTKPCGHFNGILQALNGMKSSVEKLDKQDCKKMRQIIEYNIQKFKAKRKLNKAPKKCKVMHAASYARHYK